MEKLCQGCNSWGGATCLEWNCRNVGFLISGYETEIEKLKEEHIRVIAHFAKRNLDLFFENFELKNKEKSK